MNHSDQVVMALRKKFWWLAFVTVAIYFFMRWFSGGISGAAIVALEMAKTPERVHQLLEGVDLELYRKTTYADFLFLIAYSSLLFYGSRWLGHLSEQYLLRKAGNIFSILVIFAGLADFFENLGLLHTLNYGAEPWQVELTNHLAVTKFSILVINLLFCLTCLLFLAIEKLQPAD